MAENEKELLEHIGGQEYKYGFTTQIDTELIRKGLDEEVVRLISAKKGEPEWMTERRVAAFRHWLTLEPPTWAHLTIPQIDFQDIIYYAAPKPKKQLESMDEVDPELKRTFDKLGIPLEEQMALAGVAVDAVMDSVSVKTTFKETLAGMGIVFCSISEALRDYPDLVRKYLGSVVPYTDNFYAALNAAVFSDGSFCYIPKGVRCPMELSTYFRINAAGTGQFERTLIVADEGAYVSYLEGVRRRSATRTSCTPPSWRSSSRRTPRSNIPPCRTGIPATARAAAAFTTSSPSAASAARTRVFRGRRSRPVRPLRGNIPAASSRATIPSASFIPSP